MHTRQTPSRVLFAGFEFDRATGELFRDGSPVRLQEQPRQVLTALLERPGNVVTREDLRQRLWGGDTFVDFEHGLNTAVKKLRHTLGDSAEAPQFIETLARRGYRFIGEVGTSAPEPGDEGAARRPDAKPHGSRWPHRAGWLVIVGLLAVAAGLAWRMAATGRTVNAQLAVMPFRVLADANQDVSYIGVGLADAITTRLAKTRRIGVRPTSAVLPFRNEPDATRIARALNVQHLLIGTIQPVAPGYRVTVQLVQADGVAVWGDSFDEPRATLVEVQDRLAEQVVGALRIELSASDRSRLRAPQTANPAAYDRYLRGRSLLLNYTEANMREAIEQFTQALELDENYAPARAGIATASAWFSVRYAHEAEEYAWAQRADDEARRALAQDGRLAEAHFARASAAGTVYGGFDWKLVLDRSATALTLDRSLDLAHLIRMRAYYHLGLFEDASREGRLAAALNPIHSVEHSRLEVAVLLFSGQFKQAIERAERLQPRTEAPVVPHYLGLARYYVGDASSARAMLATAMRRGRPDTRAQASLASVEAATGIQTQARARIAAILRGSDPDHHAAFSLGAAFAQLGEADESLTWLERAADTGFPCYPWFEKDPLLDPVRSTPRFARLLDRLKATQQDARRWGR
jgi:DNA-binding winged helix-turn-helix (wHTH) protein/TolB-like protein